MISSVEEERFIREKHIGDFPKNAIQWCCQEAGIKPTELDHIVYYWNPYTALFKRTMHMLRYFPRSLLIAYRRRDKELPMYSLRNTFVNEFGITKRTQFHYAEHHLCHAASSFLLSPFSDSAILTIDAAGEWDTTWLGIGNDTNLTRLQSVSFPHSLGVVYTAITDFLGFKANSGEGKVMGLAPYGDSERYYPYFKEMIIDNHNGSFSVDLSYFAYHYRGKPDWFSKKFFNVFGAPRQKEDLLEQRHNDIAAALQRRTEEIGISLARWLYEKTKLKHLCLSGGVCLNSVMNGKILEETDFSELYIQPAAHDAGGSIGACFLLWNNIMKNKRTFSLNTAYLGPSYNDTEYENAISLIKNTSACMGIKIEKIANAPIKAAQLISEGKIIGWFQDKMEIGPRALGNRSIITDPRDPAMKDKLNSRVKFREGFRPFAPSVLEEKLGEWFTQTHPSPFMLLVYDVIPEKRNQVPAITHI
ncbi:carbamoyltransferase, partial [Candidatus Omnitrophota bacterium]